MPVDTKPLVRRIQLEALITRREGMIAENKQRELLGQSLAYNDHSFNAIADQILDLTHHYYDDLS